MEGRSEAELHQPVAFSGLQPAKKVTGMSEPSLRPQGCWGTMAEVAGLARSQSVAQGHLEVVTALARHYLPDFKQLWRQQQWLLWSPPPQGPWYFPAFVAVTTSWMPLSWQWQREELPCHVVSRCPGSHSQSPGLEPSSPALSKIP